MPNSWRTPQNCLMEMKIHLEQKMHELTGEKWKAAFSAYVFVVAATSPKAYKDGMDRYLARIPAGTPYAHELHCIHQAISEWVKPQERRSTGERAQGIKTHIYLSDTSNQRHSYFVGLLQEQGIVHPVPELIEEFATAWIYAKIDEAIEQEK